jgi:hypothetical protein
MLTDDYGYVVDHNYGVLQNNKAVQRVVIEYLERRVRHSKNSAREWEMGRDRAVMPDTVFERESYGVLTGDGAPCTAATPRQVMRFGGVSWAR